MTTITNILMYLQVILAVIIILWLSNLLYSIIYVDDSGLMSAGLLSGGLHALSGADHLAALLPSIIGKKWWIAFSLGCIWGLGHSCSSSLLASCGYFLEDSVLRYSFISYMMQYADFAIGITLLLIGYMGILESTHPTPASSSMISCDDVEDEHQNEHHDDVSSTMFDSFPSRTSSYIYMMKLAAISSTIFINGLLLGLSWDGLPSLAPALSADSWHSLIIFLSSYGVGTMMAMAIAAGMIGLCTSYIGSLTHDILPYQLAWTSSLMAIVIGMIWIIQAMIALWSSYDIANMIVSYTNHIINIYAPVGVFLLIIYTIVQVISADMIIIKPSSAYTSSSIKASIHIV